MTDRGTIIAAIMIAVSACSPEGGGTGGPRAPNDVGGPAGNVAELPMPPDIQPWVARSIEIGRMLYDYDRFAAIGTDVMQANADDVDRASVGGYFVDRANDGTWTVLFFTRSADPSPKILARITVAEGRAPSFHRVRPPAAPTPAQSAVIKARQSAIASLKEVVQPLNPIVLAGPDAVDGKILVYLLAGTTNPHVAVLGRHYRGVASPDGTLEAFEPMSRAPIELGLDPAPPGVTDVRMFVTHLVGEWPTETHVLATMMYRRPLYVLTSRGVFLVKPDHIAMVSPPPGMQKP